MRISRKTDSGREDEDSDAIIAINQRNSSCARVVGKSTGTHPNDLQQSSSYSFKMTVKTAVHGRLLTVPVQ
jgi:hypothetical protein